MKNRTLVLIFILFLSGMFFVLLCGCKERSRFGPNSQWNNKRKIYNAPRTPGYFVCTHVDERYEKWAIPSEDSLSYNPYHSVKHCFVIAGKVHKESDRFRRRINDSIVEEIEFITHMCEGCDRMGIFHKLNGKQSIGDFKPKFYPVAKNGRGFNYTIEQLGSIYQSWFPHAKPL